MINKRYSEFLPSLQGSEELMVQVEDVSKEMEALKNCIETEVCMKFIHTILSSKSGALREQNRLLLQFRFEVV